MVRHPPHFCSALHTQVVIRHHLPPTVANLADLAVQPSLGILVHCRPPCSKIAITTISSARRPVFLYLYRAMSRHLWKCHSPQRPVWPPETIFSITVMLVVYLNRRAGVKAKTTAVSFSPVRRDRAQTGLPNRCRQTITPCSGFVQHPAAGNGATPPGHRNGSRSQIYVV